MTEGSVPVVCFLIFHSETSKDTAYAVSLLAILSKTEANPVGAETSAKN